MGRPQATVVLPATFAVLGLAVVALIYWDYARERGTVIAATRAELGAILDLKISEIVTWRSERLAGARVLATDPFLVPALERWLAGRPRSGEAAQIEARLRSFRDEYAYWRLLVIGPGGRLRLQVGPDSDETGAAPEPVPDAHAAFAIGQGTMLRLHRAGAEIHLELTLSLRATSAGPPFAHLVMQSDPRRFLYPLIQRWPTASATGETLLVRRDGDEVVFLNDLRHQAGTALLLRLPVDRSELPAAQVVQGHEGPLEGVDYRGHAVLAVARSVPDSSWFLVSKLDRAEIEAPLTGAARRAGLLALALVALAGLALRAAWERQRRRTVGDLAESEERYRRLFESALEGVALHELVTDAEGRAVDYVFLDVNPSFERLTGLRRHEVVNRPVTQVLPGIERDPFIEAYGRVVSTGVGAHLELHATPLGRTFEISAFSTGERGFATVFSDVTARRAAEERLRLLGAAVEASANALMITDRKGAIVWANESFGRLTGWNPEDCRGKTPRILKSGRHDPAFYETLWRTILSGEVWQAEMTNRRRDGELYVEEQTISPVVDEGGEITHFIAVKIDVTEQQSITRRLQESEERYRVVTETASEGILMIDQDGRILFANRAAQAIFGYTRDELVGLDLIRLMPAALREGHRAGFRRYQETGVPALDWSHVEQRGLHKSGREFPIEMSFGEMQAEERRSFVGIVRDVTAHRQLEEQLRRSQTMEAVGQLASGVAHDFNNLLGVIGGYSELALSSLPAEAPARRRLDEIRKAGEKAAQLTRQLLTLGRGRPPAPEVLDVGHVVAGLEGMLRRVIPEDIRLVTALDAPDCRVLADRGQLEQVLLNLVVNARDAMPQGGRLVIETAVVELDEAYCRSHGVARGAYVMLAVSDTGMGMDAVTREHIFEPFFTTKEAGKGTGLGLATIYGIVKQHEGHVWVYSEPGEGATFKVYLPRAAEAARGAEAGPPPVVARGSGEAVLLVEDDAGLREVSRETLAALGYAVLEAADGAEAIERATRHPEPIRALVTDMVMPGMTGRVLAERLRALDPDLKVLYVSGYAGEVALGGGGLDVGTAFLEKPFTSGALARALGELLAPGPRPGSGE